MTKAVQSSTRQRKIPTTAKRDTTRAKPIPAVPPESAPRIAKQQQRGTYVYCVIRGEGPRTFGPIGVGIEPADVYTIEYRDIAAVVSDTPVELYEPTRQNVLAHERVNETVMRQRTVIPMSFGTVFETREDVHQLLQSAYGAFADVLAKLDDKLEYGLKVSWDRDRVVEEIERRDEDVRRLKAEISSRQGSTYFARMQYGRLVDAALQSRSEQYVREIVEALRPIAVSSRTNRPVGDKMVLNAAFLVRRDREPELDAAVKAIGAKYRHLSFKYTGPWPPYNFVNIRLKLERA
jgi:hypothetical protein